MDDISIIPSIDKPSLIQMCNVGANFVSGLLKVGSMRRSPFSNNVGQYDWHSVGSLPSFCITTTVASFQEGAMIPNLKA